MKQKGAFRQLALELLANGVHPDELKAAAHTERTCKKISELVNKGFAKAGPRGTWAVDQKEKLSTASSNQLLN